MKRKKNLYQTSLLFNIWGDKIINSLVNKVYFNFLVDQKLIPIFLKSIQKRGIFTDFARMTMRMSPNDLLKLLIELKVLPNHKAVVREYKSWRDDIENRSIVRKAEKEVKDDLRRLIEKNIEIT